MKAIINRFREPSSFAAIAGLLAVFGVPAGLSDAIVQVAAGLLGIAAVFTPERGGGR